MQSVIGDVPRSVDNDSEVYFEIFGIFLCLSWTQAHIIYIILYIYNN